MWSEFDILSELAVKAADSQKTVNWLKEQAGTIRQQLLGTISAAKRNKLNDQLDEILARCRVELRILNKLQQQVSPLL
jgi:hypothetical protein